MNCRRRTLYNWCAGEPLPPFGPLLLDGSRYGALNDSDIRIIRGDPRWSGDGALSWKNAPTAADAQDKRIAAANTLQNPKFSAVPGASRLGRLLDDCCLEVLCGSHACPVDGRADQRWFVDAFGKRLRQPDKEFDDWTFNFVMPDGQARIHELEQVDFDGIMKKCRDALDACPAVKFAALGIDISANDDRDKFKHGRLTNGPRIYWQAHVYGVVRTSSRRAVWDALRPLFPKSPNIYRPLRMSPKPFDGSNGGISYICKPHGFWHTPYLNDNGEWATPRYAKPLKGGERVRYLLAMHDLGFARRIAFVGLHPVETKATKTKRRGLRLHQIFRWRPIM